MENTIFESLKLRKGMEDAGHDLKEIIKDSIIDIRNYLNYEEGEKLPDGVIPAIKKMVLIRYNQDGAEGIMSESQSSGGSTTYMTVLPDDVMRAVRKFRRLPR